VRAGRLLEEIFRASPPVAITTWDGGRVGPDDPPATIRVRSAAALARLFQAPGQLGFGRAYVAGDLDVEGDIFAALELPLHLNGLSLKPRHWMAAVALAGPALLGKLPVPTEEARLSGRRHSQDRDRAAVAYHYDVSNKFYELVLGPSMTYSCAYWQPGTPTLEDAQAAKHDLIATKLGLSRGMRLLDVGCGWGSFAHHAAAGYGVEVVGVTLSARQAEWAGASDRAAAVAAPGDGMTPAAHGATVSIRLQDYRQVGDGPYEAISSVGMSEHVGRSNLPVYFAKLHSLLRPGGKLLNQAISALPPAARPPLMPFPSPLPSWFASWVTPGGRGFGRDSFIDRYVFPDGELVEVGAVVSAMQEAGLEVIQVESLREHYGPTLRSWVANLEHNWDAAVTTAGERRARIWRLYMAASARTFETGRTSVHQVLARRPADRLT